MAECDYSGRCLYGSVLYITDENCIDYRLVSDRNYMILYMTYAAVGIPGVLISSRNILCIPLDQRYPQTHKRMLNETNYRTHCSTIILIISYVKVSLKNFYPNGNPVVFCP